MEFVAGVSHEFLAAGIHAISENLADGLIAMQQEIGGAGNR